MRASAGPIRRWTRFFLREGAKGELPGSVEELRASVIDALLRTVLAIGAVALAAGTYTAVTAFRASGNTVLLVTLLSAYALAYGIAVGVTLHPRVTVRGRARTLLAIFYGLGLVGLLEAGLVGDGRLFLFAFIALTAVFETPRTTLLALAASTLTFFGVGVGMVSSGETFLGIFDASNPANTWANWLSGTVVFLLVSLALVVSTATLTEVLNRSLRKTREAEERYRTLYSQIPSLYFTLDRHLRIASVNPAGAVQLGSTPQELEGRPLPELAPGEEREAWNRHLRDALVDAGKRHEWQAQLERKDGQLFWVGVTARSSGDLGAPEPLSVIAQDISERKEMEARILRSQKMELVGQLAGGVAHDFSNLLVPIMGHTEMALEGMPADHPAVEHLLQVSSAAERAASLSRQLLTFSRQQVQAPVPTDLNRAVLEVVRMARRVVGEDIRLDTQLERDLWTVLAGPTQVDQTLMNLMVNARDAMPQGGRITIETANVEVDEALARECVGQRLAGPHVMLAVTDSGVGMDAATVSLIWEPFFTTKAVGRGTGLGLATVFGILIHLGGSARVRSTPGGGTRFELFFPRAPVVEESPPGEEKEDEAPNGTETILVVEDDPMVRGVVVRCLHRRGYTVLEASDPAQARTLVRDHADPIHLILCDVILPECSGPTLAEEIRTLRPETRVLFMSGYTRDAFREKGMPEMEVDLLPKPFTTAHLARAVREAIDR